MAKSKQKDQMPAGIRNKLVAAICMLMVSCIMLVTSTYAWFTLSTAPEVKNISTTVAGNGSLEIALMPETGLFKDIQNGLSGTNWGGSIAVTTANNSWGNIVTLSDESYGLDNVTLLPATLNTADLSKLLTTVTYGSDGRPYQEASNTSLATWDNTEKKFAAATYGVRAIGTEDDSTYAMTTYGYVVDLAVRINTKNGANNAKLLLQTDATQRIYSDGSASDTMGGGSNMTFTTTSTGIDLAGLLGAIRVTFVQDYGVSRGSGVVLGTARLDTTGIGTGATSATADLYLCDADGNKLIGNNAVLISSLTKNNPAQISAIVWLDGTDVTNADVGTAVKSLTGTMNLQFTTDADLNPLENSTLKGVTTNSDSGTVEDGSGDEATDPDAA